MANTPFTQTRHLDQGIYAPSERGTLPVIRPDDDSFFVERSVFGQPKTYPDDVPFEDLSDFDPVTFLNDISASQVFPAVLGNVSLRDPGQMDGVIEPFVIRDKIAFTSIDSPFEAHDIVAELIDGNLDPLRRSMRIDQTVDTRGDIFDPFFDVADTIGTSGSILASTLLLPDSDSTIFPFDETVETTRKVRMFGERVTGILATAVISLNSPDDSLLGANEVSAGAGFVYDNNVPGTDSIAFGGLRRS